MLLQKLDLLPKERKFLDPNFDYTEALRELKELLKNHQFVLQSTVSTQNFAFVSKLFSLNDLVNSKVKLFLGSHPELVNESFDLKQYLQDQQKYLQNFPNTKPLTTPNFLKSFIGIGEIGLDYHYTQDPNLVKIQKQLFESQIELANRLDLPIMIHCRDAFEDLFEILHQHPKIHGKFLVHCYTGGVPELQEILSMKGKVAFGGVCTFNSAKAVQEAALECPLDSFVIETDLPFLAPTPHRGKICLPDMVQNVAKQIAKLKKIEENQIWQFSLSNTTSLFKL